MVNWQNVFVCKSNGGLEPGVVLFNRGSVSPAIGWTGAALPEREGLHGPAFAEGNLNSKTL